MLRPVYTEPENCQDCYKCIRECPVKAIRIEDNKASIIEERCIYCGHCTQVCPTGAKKIRDGQTRAKLILEKHPNVYLSLAPSYVSEFMDTPVDVLIASIKELGFQGVSETALGAELVSSRTEEYLNKAPQGVYLSSACPVVVEYIRKYSIRHISLITPIVSPMLAHAKILKEIYGEDIKIIFAGPCICKKLEADFFNNLVDVVITFKDLKAWLEESDTWQAEGMTGFYNPAGKTDASFIPYPSALGARYPVEGGMLDSVQDLQKPVHRMAFSDLSTIKDVLLDLDTYRHNESLFIELLACKGGCINGPARLSRLSPALKRYEIIHRSQTGNPVRDFGHLDLQLLYCKDPSITHHNYTEKEIKEAMFVVGKQGPEDELNCSGCGYDSCRDFAVALLEGRAEENMCVSYMRKIAHDKATALLQKIPAGVLLVNDQLKIMDMNNSCASLLGEDVVVINESVPGLNGVRLSQVCNFEDLFRTVLKTGQEITERQVRANGQTLVLAIYNIQPHKIVFGLLQNLQELNVRREWIIEKTNEVIRRHMETVQQVAFLLGENAAFTDSTLRNMMESEKELPRRIKKEDYEE